MRLAIQIILLAGILKLLIELPYLAIVLILPAEIFFTADFIKKVQIRNKKLFLEIIIAFFIKNYIYLQLFMATIFASGDSLNKPDAVWLEIFFSLLLRLAFMMPATMLLEGSIFYLLNKKILDLKKSFQLSFAMHKAFIVFLIILPCLLFAFYKIRIL